MCATLVDQWIRDGVRHAMVSPGSRSTPMALAIAARPELSLDVFHDERSAGFAALGTAAATGRPALVLCTSGTAATHLHGAVVEAHLSGLPMIVLTADRPPELRDVGAPQTIDQIKLYGSAVRWFHDPGVATDEVAHTWRALARHSVESSLGRSAGPVHLNLPFREPLVAEADELPEATLGDPSGQAQGAPMLPASLVAQLAAPYGVVVAGRGVDDPEAVMRFAAARGWPVLADPRSGCRGSNGSVAAFDGLLREPHFVAAHRPDVVLHLGEAPASKVTAMWLAQLDVPQVRVTPTSGVIDPSHSITHRLVGPVGSICSMLADVSPTAPLDPDWLRQWSAAAAVADAAIESTLAGASVDARGLLAEPLVARTISEISGRVIVASSMPVRDLEWFGSARQRARVWSNRGANGIDGTVATAIGMARAEAQPVTVLLGDVAFLHDASSLTGLAGRDVDVRIVVIDNDGGGIFSFLPQASALDRSRFEQLFGTPHATDIEGLARAYGLRSVTVRSQLELEVELGRPGSSCIRVASDRDANVSFHAALHDSIVEAVATLRSIG
jgi:2-succinyl-5-enolpyruvyl-6-hydroxy-3-cyclohexene-1-carboxylate synthase